MSKRMMINLLAATMVIVGGTNLTFASAIKSPIKPMVSCSGGGGSCSCDAGQACIHYNEGCACKNM